MGNTVKETVKEFNEGMVDIRKTIPAQYGALMAQKDAIMDSYKLDSKTKWLLMLVATVSQHCPVCVPVAVKRCLENGCDKEEILEAAMVAVLAGGSSAMTYVVLVDKALREYKN